MKKFGCMLVLLMLSTSAFAASEDEDDAYWVSYEFPATASGKQVAGVYAHTGVLREGGDTCGSPNSNAGTWDDTQHLQMTRIGDHFFAKTRLTSHTGECQTDIRGPVVQYGVTFTDGGQITTDIAEIAYVDTTARIYENPGELDWDRSVQAGDEDFAAVKDAPKTSAIRLQSRWDD